MDSSLTPLSNSGNFKFISDNAAVIGVLLSRVGTGGLSDDSSPPFGSLVESRSMEKMHGIRRLKKELKEFPPLLSTLDKSGQPRFSLIKLRSNRRLMIALVKNDRPRIIRSYGRNGRLILKMVKWNEDGEDSEEVGEERAKNDNTNMNWG